MTQQEQNTASTIVEIVVARTPDEMKPDVIQAMQTLVDAGFTERLFREICYRFDLLAFNTTQDLSVVRHECRGQISLAREMTKFIYPERFGGTNDTGGVPANTPQSTQSGENTPQTQRPRAFNPAESEGFGYGV